MFEERKNKIENIVNTVVTAALFEVVDLRIGYRGRTLAIEVLTDKPQGGITIEECARINKQIISEIELQQVIVDNYVVEVSSPGLDRPLKTQKDFLRLVGYPAHFYLAERVNDRLEHEGTIQLVHEEHVLIQTLKGEVSIPLGVINKAVQVIE